MKRKIVICILVIIILGLLSNLIYMLFFDDVKIVQQSSSKIAYPKVKSTTIVTHNYFGNITNPITRINSVNDLNTYTQEFDDDELKKKLNEYDDKYFNTRVLIIVAIQENSGSNYNSVDDVVIVEDNILNILTKRNVPEVGTMDMAMNYLIIEIHKLSMENINEITLNGTFM